MRFVLLSVILVGCEAMSDVFEKAWAPAEHPCVGNRTDALWLDDEETAWVGCGSTTEGYGLFTTTNGGATWGAPTTEPAGYFDNFRATDLSRSEDGDLYVAGTQTGGAQRVVALDAAGMLREVFSHQEGLSSSYHVGTFRRNSAGFAVAESLTGTDVAYREDDASEWLDGSRWASTGGPYQILDLDLWEDAFYACGSTIAEPPLVFLPPASPSSGFTLDPVQLAEGIDEFTGEMWSLDVDAGGIVVGGVDQERGIGMIYVSGDDPRDPVRWTATSLQEFFPEETTWIHGVCRSGDLVMAVGERTMSGQGLVLVSVDGGTTFEADTPVDSPALQQCTVLSSGLAVVAGADGFFARIWL